jgi:hypothetical protein
LKNNLKKDDEMILCLIINTSGYCSIQIEGICKLFQILINPRYIEKIEMKKEKESYEKYINNFFFEILISF